MATRPLTAAVPGERALVPFPGCDGARAARGENKNVCMAERSGGCYERMPLDSRARARGARDVTPRAGSLHLSMDRRLDAHTVTPMTAPLGLFLINGPLRVALRERERHISVLVIVSDKTCALINHCLQSSNRYAITIFSYYEKYFNLMKFKF
ncbi:unnamed protein product, partial [Iphiclides podalirius]